MSLRRGTAALLLAGTAAVVLTLLSLPVPVSAAGTTLRALAGTTLVAHAGAPPVAAADGEVLGTSDEIRTVDGTALLTFADGSTLSIDPGTTVRIEELSLRSGSTTTRLVQALGRTWSSVSRLGPSSRYQIRTPSVTATVRGTAFEIGVSAEGVTLVRTAEGAVTVANDLGEVRVPAGTQTTTAPAEAPPAPVPPPPSTTRTVEIGRSAVVLVDGVGRSCGRTENGAVQQIPGCVVKGAIIEISGRSATDPSLVVASGAKAGPTARTGAAAEPVRVTQRVAGPDPSVAPQVTQVEVASRGTLGLPIVTPPPSAAPTFLVDVPFIGNVPVQAVTPAPFIGTSVTPASASAIVPAVSLPPLPALATAAPAVTREPIATIAPAPLVPPTVTIPPAATLAPATVAPTAAPAVAPAIAPTIAPATAPTVAPAGAPTIAPSVVPTAAPTVVPTSVPTVAPTLAPGIAPTSAPTVAPTIAPTIVPTTAPTIVPTSVPSIAPTLAPVLP